MADNGRRVLITGASSGIGKSTAHVFADTASQLFLVARDSGRLEEVARSCLERGAVQVVHQSHDLSESGQGAVVVQECIQQLGGLDVLVSNAGFGIYGPQPEVTPAQMERIWQVNFQSGYESIHAALPHMLERRSGHIVLVSSVIGKKALPYAGSYCATKAAQISLGEALWSELKGSGVGVSVICPGYTATEFQSSAHKTESLRSMRRLGGGQPPQVVARAILRAVDRGSREIHLTLLGKLLCGMDRLSPNLVSHLIARILKQR